MIVAILNMFLKRHLRSNLFNNILMLILSIILFYFFLLFLNKQIFILALSAFFPDALPENINNIFSK